MKHKFFILLAGILALFLILLLIKNCQKCKDYPCKTEKGYVCLGYQEIAVVTIDPKSIPEYYDTISSNNNIDTIISKRKDTTIIEKIRYECNQIIFAPSLATPYQDTIRKYLECQGFSRDRTCACSDSLELWTYQEPGDANLIEVVKDPPKDSKGNSIGGLSLNYVIPLNDQMEPTHAKMEITIKRPPDTDPILIGISDSGVDLENTSPFINNGYLWTNASVQPSPCMTHGQYGLSLVIDNPEPNDHVGHGNFINGIIIGAARGNDHSQKSIPFGVKLLNIKNSNANSFSVFDAICGLYFGVEQGVQLFNISWGFLEEKDAGASEIFKLFLRTTPDNVLLVAGTGNKGNGGSRYGVSLDSNARFWPACLAETEPRVISVGALNENCSGVALFSNYSFSSQKMTLLAPGENILSLGLNSQPTFVYYVKGSGTSYATPFATRNVAVMLKNGTPAGIIKVELQNSLATLSGIPMLGM